MATIPTITTGASASSSISYALGKNRKLDEKTEFWLQENGLQRPSELEDCRAVAVGGTNGVDPMIASQQFAMIQHLHHQTKKKNQVARVIQSFALDELDPTIQENWQKANDLGVAFAEKMYPDYQCAVYTHVDGKNHVLHNHIIVNKVHIETGKKLREAQGKTIERARKINDELALEQGWSVLTPQHERKTPTEKALVEKKDYSYIADLRSRINSTMQHIEIDSLDAFKRRLDEKGVTVTERGQTLSYAFLDANKKQRRVRAERLGTDFDKEIILNELENRTKHQYARRNRETNGKDNRVTKAGETTSTGKSRTESEMPATRIARGIEQDLERRKSTTRHTQQDLEQRKSFVTGFSEGIQQLKRQLPELTQQVERRITQLKQSILNTFEATFSRDMEKKRAQLAEEREREQRRSQDRGMER